MANKSIVDVDTLNSLADSDSLFVNSDGSLKQVAVEDAGLIKTELLWENASPTSAFAAQTISLGEYDYYLVYARFNDTEDSKKGFIVHGNYNLLEIHNKQQGDGGVTKREANVTNNGISFSAGVITWGTGAYNNACIPIEIYGIKGIQ